MWDFKTKLTNEQIRTDIKLLEKFLKRIISDLYFYSEF